MERFTVYQPRHSEFGKRRKITPTDIRGEVWMESAARWYFNSVPDIGQNWGNGPWPSRAVAEQACLLAAQFAELAAARECSERAMREELELARNAAKAAMDLRLCMDVVADYRGPRGEHYKVEFIAANC